MGIKRSEERADFLATIVTTAVEGGINYWSHVSGYRWGYRSLGQSDGQPLPADVQPYAECVVHVDDEDGEPLDLNIDVAARGLRLIREGKVSLNESIRRGIMLADRTNGDDGDIDAGDADCIVQAGLFREIVYG